MLAYFHNAKYIDISCHGIKPLYNGTKEDLMPFLLCLDIRHQDEGWAPATYTLFKEKSYDLTYKFAHITETVIAAMVEARWTSPTVQSDKPTIDHDTSHLHFLAKCLLNSISSDLKLMILNRIPAAFCNDGTYILWTITNNIHWNNIAFIEHIREKISTATLAHHHNNIEKYQIFNKNNQG